MPPGYRQHRPEHTAQLPVERVLERVLEGELIGRTSEVVYVYDAPHLQHSASSRGAANATTDTRTAILTYETTLAAGKPATSIGALVDRFA